MAIISKENGTIKGTGNPNLDVNIQDGDTITPLIYIDYSTTPPTFYKFNDNLVSGSKWVLDNTVTNADSVPFTPVGSLVSTDVQSAVEEVQDNVEDIIANEVLFKTTIAALRASTATHDFVYITDNNQTGVFKYDSTDVVSTDNTGTVLVSNNGRRYKRQFDGAVNVKWFGAKGDGVTDDQPAIQNAISNCILLKYNLFLPSGSYKINNPLLVAYDSNSDLNFEYSSITIFGENKPYLSGSSTNIVASFSDTFALGLHRVKGCTIKDLRIVGTNQLNFTLKQSIENDPSLWASGTCRDSRYSPYSGIVVDPFGQSLPVDGGYPGFTPYYVQVGQGGSTGVDIINVEVDGFVVGMMFSPSGTIFNCDVINVESPKISNCKSGMAFGQSQIKGARVENIMSWNTVRYLFDGLDYGSGNGYMPFVDGGNVAGNVRSLFKFSQDWTPFNISNFYAESIHSLGYSTSASNFSLNFTNCDFRFNTNYANSVKNSSCLLEANKANFESCSLLYYGLSNAPMTFYVRTSLTFNNSITTDLIYNIFGDGPEPYANVSYRNHRFISYLTNNASFTSSSRISALNSVNSSVYISNGGEIGVDSAYNEVYKDVSKYGINLHSIETSTITISGNEATFTAALPGRYKVGDVLFSLTPLSVDSGSSLNVAIGKVKSVVSTTVTLDQIPYNLIDGVYNIYSFNLPKNHSRTFGTGSIATSTISNILCEDNIESVWSVGDKIYGTGISNGTYVTARDNTAKTITISSPLTATITDSQLYGAETVKLARYNSIPTTGGWSKGDLVYNTNPTSVFAWVCSTGGVFSTATVPTFSAINVNSAINQYEVLYGDGTSALDHSSYLKFKENNILPELLVNAQTGSLLLATNVAGSTQSSTLMSGFNIPTGASLLTYQAAGSLNIGNYRDSAGAGINFYGSLNGAYHSFVFFHNKSEIGRIIYDGTLSFPKNNQQGNISTSTNGSGDITVTFSTAFASAPTAINITSRGTTPYVYNVTARTTTNFTVRVFDMTGAAVSSTAIDFDWTAIK